jgi:hypothetical protein
MRTPRPTYRISVETPEEKRQLGKFRHGWDVNIKVDLKEIGCEDINRIRMSQDMAKSRVLVGSGMQLRVP